MRRALVTVAIVVLVTLVPGVSATAGPSATAGDRDFTFFGSGFGHGLGMSQWGAYGLAQAGWTNARILAHFYSGTRVDRTQQMPASLRIGLAQGKDKFRLEAEAGPVELHLGDPKTGDLVAKIPRGEMWTVRIADQAYKILDASGSSVGNPVGGSGTDLFAVYETNDARVKVPEALHTYSHGSIEFNLYNCQSNCTMRLVLTIDPEQYLYGLGEVPSSWPMEAMEAQAIAARTYALRKADAGQHRSGCNCALYASSYDQVYAGWDKEGGLDGNRWVNAVDNTKGRIATYRGEAIQAFYMSSSGGFTEDNENVWGGTPIAYLRGVCDPGDYTSANPSAVWQSTFSAAQVTQDLGLGIGTVTGFDNVQRGVSGRITSATVTGENGTANVSGSTLRSALGLRDDRVWINKDRQVTGSIREKYDAMNCSPGLPTTRQVAVAGGARQEFEDATIYQSAGTGAHALDGAVLGHYLSQGGPEGSLGFPISDVRTMDNGNTRAAFEHGVVTCTSSGACSVS
jgi:SpoIID/LytB domain protein